MILPTCRYLLGILAACSLLLAAPGCEKAEEDRPRQRRDQQPIPVTLAPAQLRPVQRTVKVVGTLFGDEETAPSAKVPGLVAALYKDVGDRAAPGEALAQLDRMDYELMVRQRELAVGEVLAKLGLTEMPGSDFDPVKVPTVERARLQAANSEAKLSRGRQLHEQNPPLISDQDYANLETDAAVARSNYDVERLAARALVADARVKAADLQLARQRLIDTTIKAPPATQPSGVQGPDQPHSYAIAARMVSPGDYAREGTVLFRLVDDDPVKLRADLAEQFISRIEVGQRVRVTVEAYPEEFQGQIARMTPQVDQASRTIRVEVVIPNPRRVLKPGGFARGMIETHVDPAAVFVPRDAVLTFSGVSKVFNIYAGRASEIRVELGQTIDELIEIRKGLQGDEQVVLGGLNRMAGGVPVTVGPTTAPSTRKKE